MKALVCNELGTPDQLMLVADWPEPVLGDQDVLIRVKAVGLNFPDVLVIQGKYQFKPPLPFVPGAECAGDVIAVGAKVSTFNVGDKVISLGVAAGTLREKIAAHQSTVLPMPQGLSYEQAAGVSVTYLTSYYALKQCAGIRPGETLLVMGAAGGVGAAAIQLGKLLGATVIAAASSDDKLALCQSLGADELINYSCNSLKERIKTITSGRGVDIVVDTVGGDLAESALRSIAWQGRYLVVGFASGAIPAIPLNLVLLKGCAVRGVFFDKFAEMEPESYRQNVSELWLLFSSGRLIPAIMQVYPVEDYKEAFNCLLKRQAMGKVIIRMADSEDD